MAGAPELEAVVLADGTEVATALADKSRKDVAAGNPGFGPNHGFDLVVGTKARAEVQGFYENERLDFTLDQIRRIRVHVTLENAQVDKTLGENADAALVGVAGGEGGWLGRLGPGPAQVTRAEDGGPEVAGLGRHQQGGAVAGVEDEVAASALTDCAERVLALGDGRFRSKPVRVGIESGDRVVILEGLAAGDRVVTSGQFLIDSESNIESALSRMNDGDTDDHSEHEATTDTTSDASTMDLEMDEDMDHNQQSMDPVEVPAEMDPEMDHSQHQMEGES